MRSPSPALKNKACLVATRSALVSLNMSDNHRTLAETVDGKHVPVKMCSRLPQ